MTEVVRVRPLDGADSGPLAALYRANRAYLAPFEPARDEAFSTPDGETSRIAGLLAEQAQDGPTPT